MEAQRPTPCPWLLDASGAIDHGRPRTPSRCGADPARGELSNQIRERRCLTGSACGIRDAREAALGPLAAALAPRQPVGDAELLSGSDSPKERPGRPWVRLMLIASLAALLVVGGEDHEVLRLNRLALRSMRCEARLEVVPGATHLFEEPGTLEAAATLAADWFVQHLSGEASS